MAFKEGSCIEDIVSLIRQIIVTAKEFEGEHVHVANNDVKTAYDVMRHEDLMHAMKARGLSSKEAWVVAREMAGAQLLLEVPATGKSVKVPMEKGGVQGGVMTPDDWNDLVEDTMEEVVEEWEKEGVGVNCGDVGRLTHLVWADNIGFSVGRERN